VDFSINHYLFWGMFLSNLVDDWYVIITKVIWQN